MHDGEFTVGLIVGIVLSIIVAILMFKLMYHTQPNSISIEYKSEGAVKEPTISWEEGEDVKFEYARKFIDRIEKKMNSISVEDISDE